MVTEINLIPTVAEAPDLVTTGVTLISSNPNVVRMPTSMSGGLWTADVSFSCPRIIKTFQISTNPYISYAYMKCFYKDQQVFYQKIDGNKNALFEANVIADKVELRIQMSYLYESIYSATLTGIEPLHLIQAKESFYTVTKEAGLLLIDKMDLTNKEMIEANGFNQRRLKKSTIDALKNNVSEFKFLTYFPWKE